MKKLLFRFALGLITMLILSVLGASYFIRQEFKKLESDDPRVWQSAIDDFKSEDMEKPVPEDAALFIGSSSIRFWGKLEQDMAPIPVIRRGFGGAKMRDIIYYADQIIVPYHPKAIVLFAGTNDICGLANDKRPEQLLSDFKMLVAIVEEKLPETPLYFLSITPTKARWEVWPQVEIANHLIKAYAEEKEYVRFIDATPFLLTKGHVPNDDLLWYDGVHLNRTGYQAWTMIVKERLLKEVYPYL